MKGQEWIEDALFYVLVYQPFRIPDSLACSVKAVPPVSMQCEKSFTPCENGLSPVLDLQKRKWPETLFLLLQP